MERFFFEVPGIARKTDAVAYISEFLEFGSDINGSGGLHRYLDDYEGWLDKLEDDYARKPGEDKVPARTYFLIRESDDRIVGMINIRTALNERLRHFGGHMGYSIRPTERGKGYNRINLYLGLKVCAQYGIDEVFLDADLKNPASWRTMEALGGKRIREYFDDQYAHCTVVDYVIDVRKALDEHAEYEEMVRSSDRGDKDMMAPYTAGIMDQSVRGKEWTFNTVADTYEKIRPGYPDELYRTLFAYAPLDASGRAAEIGIGGGQAAPPILKTGCELTAVEYGDRLARLCREKFRDYPRFSVITGKFEEVFLPEDAFDLVYSASAFHWVPEEIGYPKVFRMLKPGGAFARFANHPYQAKDDPALFDEIQQAYAAYYYPYYRREPGKFSEYTEEQAAERAAIAEKYGFSDVRYALFRRKRVLTAAEYRMLLGTYSDHITIEESVRERFFDAIEETILRHGGSISIFDTIDLQLARKPRA